MPLRWRRDEDDGEQKDTEGQAVRPRFRGGEDADEGTQDAEGHGFRIKREEDEGGEDTEGQGFRGRIREDESPDAQGGDRDGDTEGQGRVWSDRRLKRNIGKAHGMDLQGL